MEPPHIVFNTDLRDQVEQACQHVGAEILDGPDSSYMTPKAGSSLSATGQIKSLFDVVYQPANVRRYGEVMRFVEQAIEAPNLAISLSAPATDPEPVRQRLR
jgi:hypothetical protein